MSAIFISYRRDDSAPWAGRLRDRLAADLGEDRVFFDIDNIDLGQNFRAVVASTLESCGVVLVLIGPSWLGRDESGRRRIDDDGDLHRIEIATALRSGVRVIPVLVGGASMPATEQLPPDLKDLASRNALRVTHDAFRRDVEVLERAIRRIEEAAVTAIELAPVATQPLPADEPSGRQSRLQPAPRRARSIIRPTVVVGATIVVLALGAWLVTRGRNDDAAPPASSSTVAASNLTLPAKDLVFGRPVDDVRRLLGSAGLVVREDRSGCSESTDPGAVRQVTVGRDFNQRIIFGKESDLIDTGAASALKPGDEVTVWTPTKRGC